MASGQADAKRNFRAWTKNVARYNMICVAQQQNMLLLIELGTIQQNK